jgi:hypothetical protein
MKKLQLSILAIASLISVQSIKAQTVDEIVAKNIEAMGGKEKLNSIKTVKFEGTMNSMGQEVAMTITKSHNVGQRVDIAVMGMNGYQINTPTAGWNYMPFAGQASPQALTEEEVKSRLSQLDLHGTFNNYQEKGTQLELLGKETTDGEECYKIKGTAKSGNVTTYYISTKTNYLVKSSGLRKVRGEDMEVATTFSNYKTTTDGFVFAYTNGTQQGDINYEKIEVNQPVDESLFTIKQ